MSNRPYQNQHGLRVAQDYVFRQLQLRRLLLVQARANYARKPQDVGAVFSLRCATRFYREALAVVIAQ